jgi:hypothetical protein
MAEDPKLTLLGKNPEKINHHLKNMKRNAFSGGG